MEKINKWIANRIPNKIAYFVGIRLWANATTGQYSKHDATIITMDDCLVRWNDKYP